MTNKKKEELIKRLSKFIIKGASDKDCYGWKGAKRWGCTPRVWYAGNSIGANRLAWMAYYGKIPAGYFVRTSCNNRECTNPLHLFISTEKALRSKVSGKSRLHRQRLSVDLPHHLMEGIRFNAKKRNITITRYISQIVNSALKLEKTYEK